MDGSRGARVFRLKLALDRLRPCIGRRSCSALTARPDESPRQRRSRSRTRAPRRSGSNRVSLAIFSPFAIISSCRRHACGVTPLPSRLGAKCPRFRADGRCCPEFRSLPQKSMGRARHAVGERDCRRFRFLAALMIFHRQSSPGSPRRRALQGNRIWLSRSGTATRRARRCPPDTARG